VILSHSQSKSFDQPRGCHLQCQDDLTVPLGEVGLLHMLIKMEVRFAVPLGEVGLLHVLIKWKCALGQFPEPLARPRGWPVLGTAQGQDAYQRPR
jgi:hypothetical protein